MEDNAKKPLKIKLYFSGKPLQPAAAAPTCSLCARTFSSVKSLHGHMRWHRAPGPATQKPSGHIDPSPRLQSLLRSWSRTAKRTHLVPVEGDLQVFDGVEDGTGRDAPDDEATLEISLDAGVIASEEDMGTLVHCGGDGEPSAAQAFDCDCCRRRRPAPCTPAVPLAYACGPCGKAFATHHALCGHMASHGKLHSDTRDESTLEGSPRAPKKRRVKGANPAEHRCKLCGRVFPTGQALGGHMRLHWEGPKICPTLRLLPPSPTLLLLPPAPNPADMENKPARVHDFDLNERPVVEQGGAGGNLKELLLLV